MAGKQTDKQKSNRFGPNLRDLVDAIERNHNLLRELAEARALPPFGVLPLLLELGRRVPGLERRAVNHAVLDLGRHVGC